MRTFCNQKVKDNNFKQYCVCSICSFILFYETREMHYKLSQKSDCFVLLLSLVLFRCECKNLMYTNAKEERKK